jgi:hypothetical protein
MNKTYDIVIIGAGPAGLALAQCCSNTNINQKILIIDKEEDIGGCHRVRRVKSYINNLTENLFTEHGPRIYSLTYKVFIDLLKEMNIDFYDLFTPYNFQISTIGNQTIWNTLSFTEMYKLFIEFLLLIININHGDKIIIKDFMKSNNFKQSSIDIIDRICRLTDGASSDNYTLNEFLQLFNQQFFYQIYQPKLPNDIGLFKLWKGYLLNKNVDFMLSSEVNKLILDDTNTKIKSIRVNDKIINGNIFIIATPPLNIISLLEKSENKIIKHSFGDFDILKKWAYQTAYIDYISVTFHWNTVLSLPKVYGFPKTSWGVAYIVLSDYMKFEESNSKTVISTAITITDVYSPRINKIPDECLKDELINEIFYQLQLSFPDLPKPTASLMSPGVKYYEGKWKSFDTAFIASSTFNNLPFNSINISNLYNVGTHNGNSLYKFTSLESAVTNSVKLSQVLFPELEYKYNIHSVFTVRDFIILFIIVFIIVYLYYGQR